ncbi:hypothetical protein TYRP_013235 [Tyrophagus putrescentiae]|nr:hypothetical protein TYRP_013235 [Tyrophagus putrescentiae]
MLVAGAGADLAGTGSANLLDFWAPAAAVLPGELLEETAAPPLTLFPGSLTDRLFDLTLIFNVDIRFTLVFTLETYLLISFDVSGGAANAFDVPVVVPTEGVPVADDAPSLAPLFADLLFSTEMRCLCERIGDAVEPIEQFLDRRASVSVQAGTRSLASCVFFELYSCSWPMYRSMRIRQAL